METLTDEQKLRAVASLINYDVIEKCEWDGFKFRSPHSREYIQWQPLTNTVDALQLALLLRISINFNRDGSVCIRGRIEDDETMGILLRYDYTSEELCAAIVNMAIKADMPKQEKSGLSLLKEVYRIYTAYNLGQYIAESDEEIFDNVKIIIASQTSAWQQKVDNLILKLECAIAEGDQDWVQSTKQEIQNHLKFTSDLMGYTKMLSESYLISESDRQRFEELAAQYNTKDY